MSENEEECLRIGGMSDDVFWWCQMIGIQEMPEDEFRWGKVGYQMIKICPVILFKLSWNPVFSSDLFRISSDLKFCNPVINEPRWEIQMSSDEKNKLNFNPTILFYFLFFALIYPVISKTRWENLMRPDEK